MGDDPSGIATGDLDGDGDLDLAVVNRGSASLTVLKNGGDGTFGEPKSYQTGSEPAEVVVADLTGDGWLDVAVRHANNDVVLFPNGGKRSSDPLLPANLAASDAGSGEGFLAADLDGDGLPDLAAGGVDVFLNGAGKFPVKASYVIDGNAWAVGAGDLDGDDRPELIVSTDLHTTTVLANSGGGAFALPGTVYKDDDVISSYAVCDFNGDGLSDLAAAIFFEYRVGVRLAAPAGAQPPLGAPMTADLAGRAIKIVAGDFDGDQSPDILAVGTDIEIAPESRTVLSVLLNKGL